MSRWSHFRSSLSRQSRGRSKDTIAIVVLAAVGDRDDALDLHPAESLAALLGARRRRRIRPHHRRVHDRPGGHPGPGPGGRHRRHPDRQGHLGRPRRRPRRRRHGHRAQVHGTDPPRRDPAAAAENQPQRHGRRGRPGNGKGHIEDGYNFPLSQTEPNVNLDAFLATLDADTRQYIQLLVAGGAQGIGGRGRQLSARLPPPAALRRTTSPTSTGRWRQRREALASVIHDFGLLTTELGRHDTEIERWVTSSKGALGNFANQQRSIQEILTEFPSDSDRRRIGLRQRRPLLQGRPPGPARPDPAGAGAEAGAEGQRAALRTDRRSRSAPRSAPSPAKSARC